MRGRGSTMIETLIAVAILAAVSVTAGRALVLLMRTESEAAQAVMRYSAARRFAEDFRTDVHAAIAARLLKTQATKGLSLELPGGATIAYRILPSGVARLVFDGQSGSAGQVHPTAPAARDLYRLPSTAVTLDLSDDGRIASATLATIPAATGLSMASRLQLIVQAVVGADHRFATAHQQQTVGTAEGESDAFNKTSEGTVNSKDKDRSGR